MKGAAELEPVHGSAFNIADKRFHTPDLGGKARTADVTKAVIDAIQGADA